MPPLQGEWLEALKPEFGKPYYKQLFAKVGQEYQTRKVFPEPSRTIDYKIGRAHV